MELFLYAVILCRHGGVYLKRGSCGDGASAVVVVVVVSVVNVKLLPAA